MRCFFQGKFSWYFGCSSPVGKGIVITPWGFESICFSEFVSQIDSNNSRIIGISSGELFCTVEKFIFWILSAPPKPITIIVWTAPLRGRSMVIEDDHQSHICESLNSDIEYLHWCLPNQIWVSFQVFFWHNVVIEVELQGIGKTDAVHLELVPDVFCNLSHGPTFKPVNSVSAHVTAGPVPPCQLNSPSGGIDDFHVMGGEGEFDIFDVEERGFFTEMAFKGAASGHESLVDGSIRCVAHCIM